jgi:Ca2+ transporting ATPase
VHADPVYWSEAQISDKDPWHEPCRQLNLLARAAQDVTVLVLLGAGVLSLVLGLAVEGGDSWIEGAAIMAAVAVVVLVTAVNNFQKEAQFRELNKLNEDIQVGSQAESLAFGEFENQR